MNNSIFFPSEIVSYLHKIGKPIAAKCFEEDHSLVEEVKHQNAISWFQLYFGREESYMIFREMECNVSQYFQVKRA
jgi:hypothetical protein